MLSQSQQYAGSAAEASVVELGKEKETPDIPASIYS